jgi:hypothetical protein
VGTNAKIAVLSSSGKLVMESIIETKANTILKFVQLEVFEGQSHAQYQFDDRAPETKAAFGEITAFFDTHLGHLSDR